MSTVVSQGKLFACLQVANLLGKMGGRNRRFLRSPAELEYKENPEHGLRLILTFQPSTSFLVPLDRSIALCRAAVNGMFPAWSDCVMSIMPESLMICCVWARVLQCICTIWCAAPKYILLRLTAFVQCVLNCICTTWCALQTCILLCLTFVTCRQNFGCVYPETSSDFPPCLLG